MALTEDMHALTFDWRLIVRAGEERTAVPQVQTGAMRAVAISHQVQGNAVQPLEMSDSRGITNYNNNHMRATDPQLHSRPRVLPSYHNNQVHPSEVENVMARPRINTVGQENGGGHVSVEVHPTNTTPTLFQKFLEKGMGCRHSEWKSPEKPHTPVPTAKDLYEYPWDKSNLKSVYIKLQDFEMLDGYAAKVETKTNVEELVAELLKKANRDLEKVRAIWIWICHHIEYDVEGLRDTTRRSTDPEHIVKTGKGICAGYAGLFERMCRIAGVQCVQLSGFAKGINYRIGQTFSGESNHAWNAVHLDGKWHLVDSTWGAGFTNTISNKFTFEYNEFYFLTHPALFAEAHFPDNQNWQLLKPPLSLKQFENNIRRKSTFYNAGLIAAYPETVMIETVNGKSTITLECRSPTLFSFTINGKERWGLMTLKENGMKLDIFPQKAGRHMLCLYAKPHNSVSDSYENVLEYILQCSSVDMTMQIPRELDNPVGPSWVTKSEGFLQPSQHEPIIHSLDGRCTVTFLLGKQMAVLAMLHSDDVPMPEEIQRKHIFQVQRHNTIEFRVQVPKAGLYALKIYGESESTPDHFEYICNYMLCCRNTEVQWQAFPTELNNPVGPSLLMEEKGFLQPSHLEPIIYTTDGRCSVNFTLGKDIQIMAILHSDHIAMTEEIERRHILQVQRKNKVELKVQLPQSGSYVLKIYGDNKAHRGNFEYVCNYLICCSNTRVKWPPIPTKLQNPVGPNSLSKKKGLLQPSQREPIIFSTDGRCSVSFTLEKDFNALAMLHSDELGMTEQIERRHILQVKCENRIEFRIQLPQASTYALKIYTESKSNRGHFEYACNYLLLCTNTDICWPPFPTMLRNPVGPTTHMEKHGLLQPSHTDPIIYTADGRCSISFTLSKNVNLFAKLQSDDIIMTEDIERRHVLLVQKENSIDFEVQIPQTGIYVLKIYAERDTDPGSFSFVCNYLISCTSTGVGWPALPEELNSPVGPNWLMEKNGVFQPSHLEPIIYTHDGRCSVGFTLDEDVTLLATLHSDDITTEHIKRRHIFPVYNQSRMEFKVQVPQAGIYVLKVSAKSKLDPSNVYEFICNYLICCPNTRVKWPAFPVIYSTWVPHYELLEPLSGVLPANSNVHFKLRAEGAVAVAIQGKHLLPLSLGKDGCWEGTVSTAGCQEMYVQVTENFNRNYSSVLGYQVEVEAGNTMIFYDKAKAGMTGDQSAMSAKLLHKEASPEHANQV
ncbi:uncharacterized protein [Ambystoma mexicanum]|uniref:uncharacterized protein n=1 Tax=Ambystoma mexicanum TaxID=8296 RepID=UPI0037E95431